MSKIAMAIAAHPDDIEFMMAGTLILLSEQGYDINYMNLSTGNCGSLEHDSLSTTKIRMEEAQDSARIIGAKYHPPLCDDFEILYERRLLQKLTSVIRRVKPNIILTHSPSDYMEDHTNTSRLTTTAAFTRGIPNFVTDEPAVANYNCSIYHALPHGLLDPLRRKVLPEIFIDTASVQSIKRKALQAHVSQQSWLEDSQKMNSYIQTMENFSLDIGSMSNEFKHAEGWRRHLHYGFSEPDYDPLKDLGSAYLANKDYKFF